MRWRQFIAALAGAAVPWVARAQQPATPVIGYLNTETESGIRSLTAAFRKGLNERGYDEGRNVEILYRFGETRYDRLPELAGDLVTRQVSVIVASGNAASALAAKSATLAIPIVFITPTDPVEIGLVTSLSRPGGNLTGVSLLAEALVAKRLQLLHEIVPVAASVGYLVNPTSPQVEARITEVRIAARTLGMRLTILTASTALEIEEVFADAGGPRIDALLVDANPLFYTQREQLTGLAIRQGVPSICQVRELVDAGGLVSYGTNLPDAWRLAATYVDRILKGEKPAELPVQQATKVQLVINLKTASALGLAIPPYMLALADEVIE